ncbi:MAG: Crp/Fnr family transcriptional regulator [Deltaproteobacteria bacterium]|nr:Crp/Fnr family transcriptional regulator [Deltaproteobacteria bacterium]
MSLSTTPLRVSYPANTSRPTAVQPVLAALRCCPFFNGWSQTQLAALSLVGSLRSFGSSQVVLAEGSSTDEVIVVVRGRLRAVRRADKGREVTLEIFREGTVCIDTLFASGRLSHDLMASETSLLLFLPRESLLSQVRSNPEAALSLAKDFERRLSGARSMAAGLALADVETRLKDVLVRLAQEEGELVPGGTLIRKSPTQQELGTMIGACRETVSRIVADFARKGLVRLAGRKLTLAPEFLGVEMTQEPALAVS